MATAWLPDVLSAVDVPEWLDRSFVLVDDRDVPFLRVPKADGSQMCVPILGIPDLVDLHHATDPLRDAIEERLLPTVCGYRRGAEPGASYSREFVRFNEMCQAMASDAAYEVTADVRQFFRSLSLGQVADLLDGVVPSRLSAPFRAWIERMWNKGLQHLPAGYADARLIANAILCSVDLSIHVPFTRWVDDYRLYTPTAHDARAALRGLTDALHAVGLEIAEEKVSVTLAGHRKTMPSLTSVYHPETDSPDETRAALRRVWVDATTDPVADRRALRFVLPRLAAQSDDIAVEFALHGLRHLRWEAPRLVAYLASFARREEIAADLVDVFATAVTDRDDWMIGRLAPLVSVMAPGARSAAEDHLAGYLRSVSVGAAVPIVTRCLALSQHPAAREVIAAPARVDARTQLAVHADFGMPAAPELVSRAPATAAAIAFLGSAPRPQLDSLL